MWTELKFVSDHPRFEFISNLKFKSWMDSIRQRVYLAAELLSRTVANALETMYPNDTNMANLSKFIRLMDLWFDVFNRLVSVAFHFHNVDISPKRETKFSKQFKFILFFTLNLIGWSNFRIYTHNENIWQIVKLTINSNSYSFLFST